MRILFAVSAEPSHVTAIAALAWAARTAGHEVHVAGTTQISDAITSAGLTAVSVGENHPIQEYIRSQGAFEEAEAADWSEPFLERQTLEQVYTKYAASVPYGFAPFSDNIVDEMVEYARFWKPDLVVWDALCYAGVVAAKAIGVPHFRLLWTVDIYGAMREVHRALLDAADSNTRPDVLCEWLDGHLRQVGQSFEESDVTGHVTLDQIPTSVQVETATERVPVRYVDFNGPSSIPDWLKRPSDAPRIALTRGISFDAVRASSSMSIEKMIAAFADTEFELVVAGDMGFADSPLPPNVRVVDFVPMHALLPTCSAVIHHGGFGTWATAALHGVRQLMIPIRHGDLWIRSQRTSDLGIGRTIHPRDITEDVVVSGIDQLVSDIEAHTAAKRLSEEMRTTDSPNDVMSRLPELVDDHR